MTDDFASETAPEEPTDAGAARIPNPIYKAVRPFEKLARDISEDELRHPGTVRMILNLVDGLDREVKELRGYRDRYYSADKRVAVLESQLRQASTVDILFTVCIGLGVGLMMFAPTTQGMGIVITLEAIGLGLVVTGILAKVKARATDTGR